MRSEFSHETGNGTPQEVRDPNGLCADLQRKGKKEKKIMEEEMVGETRGTRIVRSSKRV